MSRTFREWSETTKLSQALSFLYLALTRIIQLVRANGREKSDLATEVVVLRRQVGIVASRRNPHLSPRPNTPDPWSFGWGPARCHEEIGKPVPAWISEYRHIPNRSVTES